MGTRKDTQSVSAMELDWVMFPMPKEAVTARRANRVPRILPGFPGKACRQVYMGPPALCPFWFFPLYFTESMLSTSFVAIPTMLVATIQNRAPGPPSTMAMATPIILPMPRVVASSVVRDAREDTLPEEARPEPFPKVFFPGGESPPNAHFSANFKFLKGKNRRRSIR